MVLGSAGRHTANDPLVPLPTYSPKLNPVERVRLSLRERHLSHRLLDDHDAVVEALCRAWNALNKARLRSLTSYPYLEQARLQPSRY